MLSAIIFARKIRFTQQVNRFSIAIVRITFKPSGGFMDIYTKYNQSHISDRQIDTLIGLSKGIAANGEVDQAEAEYLQTWLVQNSHSQNPIIVNLLNHVNEVLQDQHLDEEEAKELLAILHKITGETSELGELMKTSTLPLCRPAPIIEVTGKSFLFTGTFAFGTRKRCQEAVEQRGGVFAKGVTQKLDYLVLGEYVTDSWKHENFGRKIEKAMEYRDKGLSLAIVSEQHWLTAFEL